ncbi:MAG: LuxR family transcriptional regulator [Nitrosomonadales bacterium]|nr:LuxR family transcriptional regulator [Nitrosomonadales bacterium]
MKFIERFADLLCHDNVLDWRNQIFKLAHGFGYEQTMLAILPHPNLPREAEYAFQHSNYSTDWHEKYNAQKLGHVDPTVTHCANKSIPLIWSPEIFSTRKQKEMYEEACGYGIRSGVTLPIHGARSELGMVCFVSDAKPGRHFHRQAIHSLPDFSCFRDFIFESSLKFIKCSGNTIKNIQLTRRELECLKWGATGINSWEIGYLLNCTEATVNFHFKNIRRKFNTTSRQQAIVRAIKLGLIHPD